VRRIEAEATVIGDQILKIDHFLNHRIEPSFITEMGQELAKRLARFEPSVVLTAEASGIAPALFLAQALGGELMLNFIVDLRIPTGLCSPGESDWILPTSGSAPGRGWASLGASCEWLSLCV